MRKFVARQAQFFVFVGGGMLCALLDICVMQLLIRAGVGYQVGASVGFVSGLMLNYAFHKYLTFKAAENYHFVRYLCVVGINYALTMACVALGVLVLGDPEAHSALIGKLVSLPLVAVNGYLLSKYWIAR